MLSATKPFYIEVHLENLMEKRAGFTNSRKEKLVGILSTPNKAVKAILLIHGFCAGKDVGSIPHIAKSLEDRGCMVLRFDLSGYGESEGKFEDATIPRHIEDAKAAFDELSLRTKLPIQVIGHSMGAAIAVDLASERKLKSIILIGLPVKTMSEGMAARAQQAMKNGMAEFTDYFGKKRKVKKAFFDSINACNLASNMKKLSIPVLTIMGSKDVNVSVEAAKKATDAAPKHKYVEIPEANHFFIRHEKELLEIIENWIEENQV